MIDWTALSLYMRHVLLFGRRAFLRSLREPGLLVPAIILPIFFLAFSANQLSDVVRLPGFPTHNVVAFVTPIALLPGGIFTFISAGSGVAYDLQSGAFRRLALSPTPRRALVTGAVLGPAAVGLFTEAIALIAAFLAGGRPHSGLVTYAGLLTLLALINTGFSGLGVSAALLAGSPGAIASLVPFIFALLGLSTLNLPFHFIFTTWFRDVAELNPISYLVNATRTLYIGRGTIVHTVLVGAAIGAGFTIATFSTAVACMRLRVAHD
jgi:ABC-2 type transport system permease protein